jgi:hypothetical protein
LTLPRLIICEGPSDEAFFRALIKSRGLSEFSIRNGTDSGPEAGGGIDQFGALLTAIRAWRGFEQVTDIILAADNDLSPQTNFTKV